MIGDAAMHTLPGCLTCHFGLRSALSHVDSSPKVNRLPNPGCSQYFSYHGTFGVLLLSLLEQGIIRFTETAIEVLGNSFGHASSSFSSHSWQGFSEHHRLFTD